MVLPLVSAWFAWRALLLLAREGRVDRYARSSALSGFGVAILLQVMAWIGGQSPRHTGEVAEFVPASLVQPAMGSAGDR